MLSNLESLNSQNVAKNPNFLLLGRYTVNFLTPNRWYGILFRCEQQYGGPNGVVYVNEEEHLIKTHKEVDTFSCCFLYYHI